MNLSAINDSDLLSEYCRRFTIKAGESVKTSKEAASHFRAYFAEAAKREQFVVCFLNGAHKVVSTEILFVGSITTSAVYPREVVQRILDLGAAAVILAHNHPSGDVTTPSGSDRAVTKKLQTALKAIDVDVLDHLIIGGTEYYSFSDSKLL
jgi:DNA repair protein RadC